MPIDFPNSPQLNDLFIAPSGRTWRWTGVRWESGVEENVQGVVAAQIAGLVDSAPATLDTLNELAAALADDANFAATIASELSAVSSQISTKASTGKAIAMAIVFGG